MRNTKRHLLAFAIAAAILPAVAATAPRSGREVVEAQCIVCHGSGLEGAPRIGDAKAWSKRAALGLTSLTEHALAGVRRMPPHGGKLSITDLEVKRAIAYMVNQSGGRWTEPIDRARAPEKRSVKKEK